MNICMSQHSYTLTLQYLSNHAHKFSDIASYYYMQCMCRIVIKTMMTVIQYLA